MELDSTRRELGPEFGPRLGDYDSGQRDLTGPNLALLGWT